MKIIKEGVRPVKRVTCKVCGCVFEYNSGDVDGNIDDGGVDYFVECPCCESIVKISDEDVVSLSMPKDGAEGIIADLKHRIAELERNVTMTK